MKQEHNYIEGDNAGRDVNKNFYFGEASLDTFFDKITSEIEAILPNRLYNFKYNERVNFNAEALFDSLVQLLIPSKVVLTILQGLPSKIRNEIALETFSTRDLRRIIYHSLQSLDYSQYGEKIDIWGENYIRKYGNPDVEIQVILDDEKRIKPLNYEFLYDKLIPDVYRRCYYRDIDEELGLLKSKFIIQDFASEIMEKIRILNLYFLRYSTLKKLAYDMAIQPPHPWFSDKLNADTHIEYNRNRYTKHLVRFRKKENTKRSAQEFIEHICATILAKYNLFIGMGKYRPLISLTNYLKLSNTLNGNSLFWQTLDISNLPGDLFLEKINFFKFKSILDTILIRIDDCEEHYDEVLGLFEKLFFHTEKLILKRDILKNFEGNIDSVHLLKQRIITLLGYYDKMVVYEHRLKFSFIEEISIVGLDKYINIGYIYENIVGDLLHILPNETGLESNSMLIFTNREIHHDTIRKLIISNYSNVEFVFSITIDEIYLNTIAPNRRIEFESLIKKSLI